MPLDQNNKVVQLCAKGMELEATDSEAAKALFMQAWNEATNDVEKFTAAHYVARHQTSTKDKLQWDETALEFALKIDDEDIRQYYPSLYLNVAKCYEDLKDHNNAKINYEKALSYSKYLPEDEYGKMIQAGIQNGIERTGKRLSNLFLN